MAPLTSSASKTAPEAPLAFQLKGGLYPLTALQLLHVDLAFFEEQLINKISQAPKFFHNAPIVIDLQTLDTSLGALHFDTLLKILNRHHLIPVGIKGADAAQQNAATHAGLALLQDSSKKLIDVEQTASKPATLPPTITPTTPKTNTQSKTEETFKGSNTRLITEPVRSGQQIYARDGDLIVLAAVSHGSELLADGHIHVYGPLRGRALAGVTGDQNARIFCQSLEAELISIAGQYKISEDIAQTNWGLAVDISLQAGHLQIKPF